MKRAFLKTSTPRLFALTALLFLLNSTLYAQKATEFSISQGEAEISLSPFYQTIDWHAGYFDLENQVALCKAGPQEIAVQLFDKSTQTVKTESILSEKNCVKIAVFLDDQEHIIHFLYSKDAPNKLIKAQKEVYLASFDLTNGKFTNGETLLYLTSYNFSTLFTYFKYPETFESGGFICSVSEDKKNVTLAYQALYYNKDVSSGYSIVSNQISIEQRKMVSEKVLKNNYKETLSISDFNDNSCPAVSLLTRGVKSDESVLMISQPDSDEAVYINLSEEIGTIDTARFFENESNGTILVGGLYHSGEDLTRPGVFSLEIAPDGTIIQKNTHWLQPRENTTGKIYFLYAIPMICRNTDHTTDFYILNLETNTLSRLVSDAKNNLLTEQRMPVRDIKTNTRIIPHPAYGLSINSTGIPFVLIARLAQQKMHSRMEIFRDNNQVFVVQISKDPETKKDGMFITKLNTAQGEGVNYALFADYQLADGQVMKQFSLNRMIQTDKNTFGIEAYFGKKLDGFVKIKLN